MNVINVDCLERELANAAVYAMHPAAQQWVKSVARNFMLNGLNEKDASSIYTLYTPSKRGTFSGLPPVSRLPAWVRPALSKATPLYWFEYKHARRRPIWQCLEHIVHWFNAWSPDDPRWKGDRITRICWHTAAREAAMWFKDVNENLWDYVKDKAPVIRTYAQGFCWVRLSTPLHFERESRLMNHCVGNGGYYERYKRGETEYYSLRDKNNKPHCTVEVQRHYSTEKTACVVQCKGKNNQRPSDDYQRYIGRFFYDMNWPVMGDRGNVEPFQPTESSVIRARLGPAQPA